MALQPSYASPRLTNGVVTVQFAAIPCGVVDYEEVMSTTQARIKIPFQTGEILEPGTSNARVIHMTVEVQTTDMAVFETLFTNLEILQADQNGLDFYYYYGPTNADKRYLTGCYILGELPRKRSDFVQYIPSKWPTFTITIIATDPVWYTPGVSSSLSDLTLAAGRNLIIRGNVYQYNGPAGVGILTRVIGNTGGSKQSGPLKANMNTPITWP